MAFAESGGCTRGASAERFEAPLVGGAASIDACQRFFAGAQRAFGVGGTRPPRLSPKGKRERGDQIPFAAGCLCGFATLKCFIHWLFPGAGTCRRAGRFTFAASHLTFFSQTVSVTKSWPMRACNLPSSRASIRIDDRLRPGHHLWKADDQKPGRTAALGICHRRPSQATV